MTSYYTAFTIQYTPSSTIILQTEKHTIVVFYIVLCSRSKVLEKNSYIKKIFVIFLLAPT